MENEEPFAIEAQEEAILSRTRSLQAENGRKSYIRIETQDDELSDNESSPLISNTEGSVRHRLSQAAKNY